MTTGALGGRAAMVVRAHGLAVAVPLAEVVEVMRPLATEAIAGAPPFVRGLALIRGSPVPVVELACLLGADPGGQVGRFVLIRLGGRRVALAVDEITGIRDVEADTLHALPPLLRDASIAVVEQIGSLDAELLVMLRTGRLLPDDLWPTLLADGPSA